MNKHKDLPPGSQAWANELDQALDTIKQLQEVVRRLTENAGIDFSNPQRGLNPVRDIPSNANPVGQKLSSLADVQTYNVADKQVLSWSGKDQRWLPVTPDAGGFFPIPMSYEPDIIGFGHIHSTREVWNGTEIVTLPAWSYVGTKDNGVAEMWGTRSVYIGAGDSNSPDKGWTYLEQEFAVGNSYTAIHSIPAPGFPTMGARFVVNQNSIFIQYAPFYIEHFGTDTRPDMSYSGNIGGSVYDHDLKIPIWWNGTEWTNALGTPV